MPRIVTLLHLADLHSHLFPERIRVRPVDAEGGLGVEGTVATVGGVAALAGILDRERAAAQVSFTLDAGDIFEGTPVFDLFHGDAELAAAGLLQVDAIAAGNHDLDAGLPALSSRASEAPPFLGANLVGEYPDLLRAGVLLEREGVRVGVIGVSRSPTERLELLRVAEAANESAAILRPRADLLVLLSHLGSETDRELIPLTTGLDVVLGGHTHDVTFVPQQVADCGPAVDEALGCVPRAVTLVHPGAYGRYLARLDFGIASGLDGAAPITWRIIPVTEGAPESADVASALELYRKGIVAAGFSAPVAWAESDITRAAESGGNSPLGALVTEALRRATSADVAVINTTELRADLLAGVVTRGDLYAAIPFPDGVVGGLMTGKELTAAFARVAEASCARRRESQAQVAGAHVVFGCGGGGTAEVSVGGAPVDPERAYRVAACDFITEAGGWFSGLDVVVPSFGAVRDLLETAISGVPACGGMPGAPDAPALPCLAPPPGGPLVGGISWRN